MSCCCAPTAGWWGVPPSGPGPEPGPESPWIGSINPSIPAFDRRVFVCYGPFTALSGERKIVWPDGTEEVLLRTDGAGCKIRSFATTDDPGLVQVYGSFESLTVSSALLTGVQQWGNRPKYHLAMYNGAGAGESVSLNTVPAELPDYVVSTENMFRESVFNGSYIAGWDVSRVTNMTAMFMDTDNFNVNLSGWCVAHLATQPPNFDTNAGNWTLPRPNWGAPC